DQARVVTAEADVFVDLGEYFRRQPAPLADRREADVLLHDLGPLFDQILVEQGHEEIELRLRSFPVFGTQAEKRQLADAEPAALLDRRADADDAAAMAFVPGQAAFLRPAAVSVHDHRDFPWQAIGVESRGRD